MSVTTKNKLLLFHTPACSINSRRFLVRQKNSIFFTGIYNPLSSESVCTERMTFAPMGAYVNKISDNLKLKSLEFRTLNRKYRTPRYLLKIGQPEVQRCDFLVITIVIDTSLFLIAIFYLKL